MKKPTEAEVDYVIWQNRAFRFYLAARLSSRQGLSAPAAFLATQVLELLLKATLIFWDKTFKPEAAGHAIAKLMRCVRNKVSGARHFNIPQYFFHERRYQTISRYPSGSKGLFVPGSLLNDLDALFVSLVRFVPFQHNTELKRAMAGHDMKALAILRRGNASMRSLRKVLRVRAPQR